MIEVAGLRKRFGAREVLAGVSFTVRPGEIVRLLGANGAGKSTVLRCLLGITSCEGEIRVFGRDPRTDGCGVRELVGYMPQHNGLHLDLTVAQTMAFYADMRRADRARIAPLLQEAGLAAEHDTRVGELSGGMRQRLAFSVAVLGDPPVLVLDEPNASLDTASHAWLTSRIHGAAASGRVVLVSTHLGQSLFETPPRSLLLENGLLVLDETDEQVCAPPAVDASPVPRRARRRLALSAALVRKELRDGLRNSWLLGYVAVLGALGFAAAFAGQDAVAGPGIDTLGRTTATLMNLCLLLSPLLAVVMGAASVAAEAERGTLDHLLAQPISRTELLLSKHIGLILVLSLATLAGFAPAAMVVAGGGARDMLSLLLFPALAVGASCAMAAIGLFISVSSRSALQAQGTAVLVWFAAALFYDLLLIGVLASSGLPASWLAATLVANPIDAARVLGVLSLEPDLYLLGPAGAYVTTAWGAAGAAAVLTGSLLAWASLPLAAAISRFRIKQPRPRRTRRHETPSLLLSFLDRRAVRRDRVRVGGKG